MPSKDSQKNRIEATALVQGGALSANYAPEAAGSTPESLFGPVSGQARLTGNENPFGPSPAAIRAIQATAAQGCYYADRAVVQLTSMIAERHGLAFEQVILGSGTTELLCAATLAWGRDGAILCPELFWDAPINYAARKGVACIRIPMDAGLGIDLAAMEQSLSSDIALVHLVNPNNPTGRVIENETLRSFAAKVSARGATLLVDEAYNEMTDLPEKHSLADLVRAGENVIVTRTFSKVYGMAGMRMGYAIGSEENIARIRGYITSFGGNVAGIAGAIASFNDDRFLAASLAAIREGRELILDAVKRAGLSALPSQANFVFVKVPDADALRQAMAERNILVRGSFGPKWSQYSRVSVGTLADVARYAEALPEITGQITDAR